MRAVCVALASLARPVQASARSVTLLSFDGEAETALGWTVLVDPVMGGESVGTATVDAQGQYGILDGEVKIVPKLQAPGFITAYAEGNFRDASGAADGDLVLQVRSSIAYEGYRVSFAAGSVFPQFSCAAGGSLPGSRGCYKANFAVTPGGAFVDVRVPLTSFSDLWDSKTGDQTSTCAEDPSACPSAQALRHIQRVEVWAEGVSGKVHVEVRSVRMESRMTSGPATMRAGVLLNERATLPEDFAERRMPVPAPGAGEVLLRVEGSSVNPCEWKELPYFLGTGQRMSFPHISGKDIVGTVVAAGPGASVEAGVRLWGLSSFEGGHAEFAVVPLQGLAPAPTAISGADAAVMPLVGLTNLQAFSIPGIRRLWQGTVVVLGGSGGCGHLAIQMARLLGARTVVTTCSASNKAFCHSMGADVVVDYHTEDWRQVVGRHAVDFIYDTVSLPGTGENGTLDTLRDGGWYVTILSSALASNATIAAQEGRVHQQFFMLNQVSAKELTALRVLVDNGGLRPHVQDYFDLSEVALAFGASRGGHIVGKVAVVPSHGLKTPLRVGLAWSTVGLAAAALSCLAMRAVSLHRGAKRQAAESLAFSLHTWEHPSTP